MVTASRFWNEFTKALKRSAPQGYGASWTRGMGKVLHSVQDALGLWCQCRQHTNRKNGRNGERMGVDFTWYPAVENEWVAPVAAIEHENAWSEHERKVDYWKVNQIAAPLRVFIGYVRSADEVEPAAKDLMQHEGEWNPVPNGEAMIIIGHDGMPLGGFRAWACKQGDASTWQELT